MITNDIVLAGVRLVEIRWGLVWLNDVDKQANEIIKLDRFIQLLYQKFNEDAVNKICEALTTNNKLIIDFDKSKVKLIKNKEKKFSEYYSQYFTAKAAEDWLNSEEYFEDFMYKGD